MHETATSFDRRVKRASARIENLVTGRTRGSAHAGGDEVPCVKRLRAQSLTQKLLRAVRATVKADGHIDAAEHCYFGRRISM